MKRHFIRCLLAPALLFLHMATFAEDIDLFVGLTKGDVPNLPNVLFVLDNAANFSASAATCTYPDGTAPTMNGTIGGVEQCALYAAIENLEVDEKDGSAKINIGLMAYNANKFVDWDGKKCDETSSLGGCLMVPLTPMTEANKAKILSWIKTWESKDKPTYAIKTNQAATGAVMQEAWAYYSGHTGISGRSYKDIKPASVCLKNYVVFVSGAEKTPADQTGNSGPKNALEGINSASDKNANPPATAEQKKIFLGPVTTACGTVTFPTSHETPGHYADEWARYMASVNTTYITTYSIGIYDTLKECNAETAAALSSMATLGGGKYFPTTNFSELKVAFESILSEVQPVNSAFASVSLPVSVNTQGTYLNQVFIGMFRPDEDALPRWVGNLKQYKIGVDANDNLELQDADSKNALDVNLQGTGFFSRCARSFWTPTSSEDYWLNITDANCIGHNAASDTPDGNVVEKGGQGYTLRKTKPLERTVLTCKNASCSSADGLDNFSAGNAEITKAGLGDPTMSDDDRANLIDWARGLNNNGDEFGAATVMRPSVHGDVVHSRPVAINYGSDASPQVVVFYGSNDGTLRAINGNRPDKPTPDIGSAAPGTELWSFIAPETYPKLKRLRDNAPKVSFPGSTGGEPKPYGIDGPIVAYRDDTQTLVFASMRRGGNALYAFDVTAPASPALKWRFSDGDIGQTWSPPRVLKASGYPSPMLIMGGGYDSCEDADLPVCSLTKGNRVYVLNALTGEKLNAFDTARGVVAEVFVVLDATTGLAKYAYAADLGGNVYRISGADANTPFADTKPEEWTMTQIATLGCDDPKAACAANRKFMFVPDVLDDNGTYVLLLGSGDREKPLTIWEKSNSVNNHFFMLRDNPTDKAWLTSENTTCGLDLICMQSLLAIGSTDPTPEELAEKPKGWYLTLRDTEQVVTSAITVSDVVIFSTHIPADPASATLCKANLGEASVYNIYFSNAGSANGTAIRHEDVAGDGLPPSPVAGVVKTDDGVSRPFVIGAGKLSFAPIAPPLPDPLKLPRSRVYWYIEQ